MWASGLSAVVCAVYVAVLFTAETVITGLVGDWWPDHVVLAGAELAFAVAVVVALSLLGSVFLTAGSHPYEVQFYEDFGGPSALDLTLPAGVTYDQTLAVKGSHTYADEGSYNISISVVDDERTARDLATERAQADRAESLENKSKVTLENLFATLDEQAGKSLKVVVKADAQGSVEAIVEALKKIESDKVALEVIHSDVGTITENDVALASASHGVILGFHTRVDSTAAEKAKREAVQIKLYAIIYELIDQVKEAMAGLLEPDIKEVVIGSAEVRKIFSLSKGGNVAGCMVTMGRIVKGKVRIRRRKEIIYEGLTQSLRRFQDEVNEVRAGMECGIRIEGFSDYQIGDNIECSTMEKVAQKL